MMESIPALDNRHLSMTVLATPDMVNFSGKVHGGSVLKLLDQVAYACASRYCGSYVVTLSVDQVFFRKPIFLGELITFMSAINFAGRSSMEVGIKVVAQNVQKRTERHVMSSFFTMVAIGEDEKSIEVPKLTLRTDNEKRRFQAATDRRKLREEFEKAHYATLLVSRDDEKI